MHKIINLSEHSFTKIDIRTIQEGSKVQLNAMTCNTAHCQVEIKLVKETNMQINFADRPF